MLAQYKTNINQLFPISMEVMKFSRSIKVMIQKMEFLAKNGVIHASKITKGEGKALVTLGEILTEQPRNVTPHANELEAWCTKVARNTAKCSELARRFNQQIVCVTNMIGKCVSRKDLGMVEVLSNLNLMQPSEISTLINSPTLGTLDPLYRSNLTFIARRCQTNLTEILELLKESLQFLKNAERSSQKIEGICVTAKYLATHISVEASNLSTGNENFENLSSSIKDMIRRVEKDFNSMTDIIYQGAHLLEQLSTGGKK